MLSSGGIQVSDNKRHVLQFGFRVTLFITCILLRNLLDTLSFTCFHVITCFHGVHIWLSCFAFSLIERKLTSLFLLTRKCFTNSEQTQIYRQVQQRNMSDNLLHNFIRLLYLSLRFCYLHCLRLV